MWIKKLLQLHQLQYDNIRIIIFLNAFILKKKIQEGKKIKILIWSKEKNDFYFIFKSIFER
jgi:hypothetical protein